MNEGPALMGPAFQAYQHLNLQRPSQISRLQREMVAVMVNGLIHGAA